ncbi:HEPN domain-containing protein [Paenibacillus chitinolyticus]|uniref:ApeA N-terminal domain 1-containing protein n=1 Tax=Paenibacillus chitinolyticus TaxID=79263 RepID=UPI0035587153
MSVVKGYWWLPSNESKKIAGNLEQIDDGTAVLDLHGFLGHFLENEIILGVTLLGAPVTLWKCFKRSTHFSLNGFEAMEKYGCQITINGVHFNDKQRMDFDGYKFTFDYLENWLDKQVLTINENRENNTFKSLTIKYEQPEEFELAEIEGIKLVVSYAHSLGDKNNSKVSINSSAQIVLKSKTKIPLEELLNNYLIKLQNFLSLVMGKTVFPKNIWGVIEEEEVYRDVSVTLKIPFSSNKKNGFYKERVPYSLIKENSNMIINNWFSGSNDLLPIYDLYFANLYNTNLHLTNRFLNIVQALESYHRRRIGRGEFMNKARYKKLKQKLYEVLEEELENEEVVEMKSKFSHLNEMSLKNRIYDLLEKYDLKEIYSEINEDLIAKVVLTRNYFTHWDKKYEDKALKELELNDVTTLLMRLFETCLFIELGLDKKTLVSIKES